MSRFIFLLILWLSQGHHWNQLPDYRYIILLYIYFNYTCPNPVIYIAYKHTTCMQKAIEWLCTCMAHVRSMYVHCLWVQVFLKLTLQVVAPLVRMEGCVVVLTSLTVTVSPGTQVPTARQEVYIYKYIYCTHVQLSVCVCVCVCNHRNISIASRFYIFDIDFRAIMVSQVAHTHTHTHTLIYININAVFIYTYIYLLWFWVVYVCRQVILVWAQLEM